MLVSSSKVVKGWGLSVAPHDAQSMVAIVCFVDVTLCNSDTAQVFYEFIHAHPTRGHLSLPLR